MTDFKYKDVNSILTISSPSLSCTEVKDALKKIGISSNITENSTIICKNGKCYDEIGCSINLCGLHRDHIEQDVWPLLKNKFNLSCAHIKLDGIFSGCVYNLFGKSRCPGDGV